MGTFVNYYGRELQGFEVIRLADVQLGGHKTWVCVCNCGKEFLASSSNLPNGIHSCGCLRLKSITKHGQSGPAMTREYRTWAAMKARCENPHHDSFNRYGGRGITVCERWRDSFESFLEDMGRCPPKMTIDRKDNNGNYEPNNCRWATRREQARNTSKTKLIRFNGITMPLIAWAESLGMNPVTLHSRIDTYRWTIARALTTPVRKSSQ